MRIVLTIVSVLISSNLWAQKLDSLDFKIGQMLIVGVNETSAASNAAILNDIKIGKNFFIIFYLEN